MKRESELKAALMRELRTRLIGAVALRHEDRFTSGIPDISVTMGGRTSWWECKHANPSIGTQGLQELTALRLAAAGTCHYVVWEEKRGIKRTMIVHPNHLRDMLPELLCVGFDHRWLVEQIRKVHE